MESWEREKVRLGGHASDTMPESHWESASVKALLMPPLVTEPTRKSVSNSMKHLPLHFAH